MSTKSRSSFSLVVLEREPNNPDDAPAVGAFFEMASAAHKDKKAAGSVSDGLFDNWLPFVYTYRTFCLSLNERRSLQTAFDAVEQTGGDGRVVLGEYGTGKSRFFELAVEEALAHTSSLRQPASTSAKCRRIVRSEFITR